MPLVSAVLVSSGLGPESRRSTQASEIVAITSDVAGAVGDTINYKCNHIHKSPKVLGGAFAITATIFDPAPPALAAAVIVTLEARVALGNARTVHVEILGDV